MSSTFFFDRHERIGPLASSPKNSLRFFELLESVPHIGRSYRHPTVKNVRRVLLRSTRYHVYYVVHDDAVIVLAVWSAVRGSGPVLAPPA